MNLSRLGLFSLFPQPPDGMGEDRLDINPHQRRMIRCAACDQEITTPDQRIEVNQDHQHSFFNPMGIVFQIGCFSTAPGCIGLGQSSAEFSWFAGYHWRVAACSRCQTHLGWSFTDGGTSFYGLILNKLAEA